MVKVSDFGLTRGINEISDYRIQDKHKDLPIRWMSIESITEGIFTMQSDVVRHYTVCKKKLLRERDKLKYMSQS